MNRSFRLGFLGLLWLAAAARLAAHDVGGLSATVLVNGVPLPEYAARGRTYVEAVKGREFTIRLTNPTSARVAVALSIDGRNVIDAKRTTEFEAAKWILAPGESLEVPGWQISGDTARKFYFTETLSSYAKWLGDTANVGTIEAVFFRERPRPPAVAAAPRVEATAESPLIDARSAAESPLAAPQPSAETVVREAAPQKSDTKAPTADAKSVRAEQSVTVEAERFAATGMGGRTSFPVQWALFDAQPTPAARVAIRYEFRTELVRLGVLRPKDGLGSREQARGFEHDYAPDPDDRR